MGDWVDFFIGPNDLLIGRTGQGVPLENMSVIEWPGFDREHTLAIIRPRRAR